MAIALSPEIEQKLREEAARQNKTPEQVAQEALLEGLRSWREPLPPSKTLKDVLDAFGSWPGEEANEELLAALEPMDC